MKTPEEEYLEALRTLPYREVLEPFIGEKNTPAVMEQMRLKLIDVLNEQLRKQQSAYTADDYVVTVTQSSPGQLQFNVAPRNPARVTTLLTR